MHELIAGQLDEFFEVPFRIYPATSPYVSPMKSDLRRFLSSGNPLFREPDAFSFYTVRRDGQPVGRIVAHVHRESNRRHGLNRMYFGYFDCADDPEAARLLLDAAERWGRERSYSEIAGSFNLTAMQQCGIVTDGFAGVPYTDMQHNPPHIPALLGRFGYTPFFPMTTWEIDVTALNPESLIGDRERACLASAEFRWEPISLRTFKSHLPALARVLNEGFEQNPLFVPLSLDEFAFQAKEMMWIVDNRITFVVYRGTEPAGAVVCIPDVNPLLRATRSRFSIRTPVHYLRFRRRRTRAIIVFIGVTPPFRGGGLSNALLYRCTSSLKGAGYTRLGTTWVTDENAASLRLVRKLGGRRLHRLHLFRKTLVAP